MKKSQGLKLKLINLYPPFLGAGIRVKNVSPDVTSIDVELKFWAGNKNIVGTQFGGSIYAMTDPFFMLILMANLGDNYIVWDKAANVQFKKPGKTKLSAHFEISRQQIDDIRAAADRDRKTEPHFTVQVKDTAGNVVAEVEKTLYVRRRERTPQPPRP